MKLLPVIFSYLFALAVTVPVAFFAVIILAGPHSGLLPSWLEAIVLALGWLAVLVVPVLVARRVWLRVPQVRPPVR